MSIRLLRVETLNGTYWLDEDGSYYETDDLIEELMQPHTETMEYRTIWETDAMLYENTRMLQFIRDDYNIDDFDDLFREAWNFVC